jgi:hypothetical protein
MKAIHTLYDNGAVRDATGALIAFYDREAGRVLIGSLSYPAADHLHAMELVAALAPHFAQADPAALADDDDMPHPDDAPGFVEFPHGEFPIR